MLSISRSNAVLGVSHTQSRTSIAHTVRPSRCARPVVVASGLKDGGDWVASGSLNIFTPPKDAGVNWKGTSAGYSVVPRRHGARGPSAQYAAGKDDTSTDTVEVAPEEVQKEQEKGMLAATIEYIAGALQRVMGHNFKGDPTEPDWKQSKTEGWTGDIDKRKKDGFHSRKL